MISLQKWLILQFCAVDVLESQDQTDPAKHSKRVKWIGLDHVLPSCFLFLQVNSIQ